jgi:hypothetical protein
MQEFFTHAGVVLLICSPLAAVIAFGIYKNDFSRGAEGTKYPDERELNRREYETMLRHRRRAKLERQFNKLQLHAIDTHKN